MIEIKNMKIFNCSSKEKMHWSKLRIKEKMCMERFKFNGQIMDNADLCKIDLAFSELNNTKIRESKLNSSCFKNAKLNKSEIQRSQLNNTDFSYSELKKVIIEDCQLTFSNFRGANLEGGKLKNCLLNYSDFRFCNLSNCDLSECDISCCDFRFAKFKNTKIGNFEGKEVLIDDFMSVYPVGKKSKQMILFKSNLGILIKYDLFFGREENFYKYIRSKKGRNNIDNIIKIAQEQFKRKEAN